MASAKAWAWTILMALLLAALAAGSAFLYLTFRQHQVGQELDLVETDLSQGTPDKIGEAEQILAKRLDQGRPRGPWLNRAVALRFRVFEKLKDPKAAQALAQRVLDPADPLLKPGQEGWARAHLALAQVAIDANEPGKARPHLTAILSLGVPNVWGKDEATVALARVEMAQDEVSKAQKELTELYNRLPENASPDLREAVEYALGLCNRNILLSPEPMPGDQIYVLRKGDTLDRLRKKFKVSPEIIMGINQIPNPRRLTINRRIKIPHLEFSIVVNKSDNTLTLFNHSQFFKKYRVRTGQQESLTPVGDFKIQKKDINPSWTNPKDGKVYKGGEPGNELGCRWMEIQGSIGIHEATDPSTIGKYASNGCVGMKKEDVIELFELVPMGTPVKIIGHKAGATN